MQLTSGHPFWPAKHGFLNVYEPATESASCDVLVIGGGITGALLASAATEAGYQTILLDSRNCGFGSTAATTALIQYEIDTHLVELTKRFGEEAASTSYRACREAIDKVKAICESAQAGDFQPTKSYYLASSRWDIKSLREEYEARRRLGLEVDWLSDTDLKPHFDAPVKGALLSHISGAIDAFELTHALLKQAQRRGLKVYARTLVEQLQDKAGGVEASTDRGPTIKAKWAVVAAGYESLQFLTVKPKVTLHNSFAFATEQIPVFAGWPNNSILWESARPYFYARATTDGRAIFGGADIPFKSATFRDGLATKQQSKLEKRWNKLFPRIPLEVAVTWAGTFAETPDGLPYIGFPVKQPRTFFALCYGGNGIAYSVLAAEMLIAALRGEHHKCAEIFRMDRT